MLIVDLTSCRALLGHSYVRRRCCSGRATQLAETRWGRVVVWQSQPANCLSLPVSFDSDSTELPTIQHRLSPHNRRRVSAMSDVPVSKSESAALLSSP